MIPNIKQQYRELIKSFLIENNIKVYTTDELIEITWNNLYLHFTCDYAQCIAKMEHDLFQQTRNMQHNNYNFIFDED